MQIYSHACLDAHILFLLFLRIFHSQKRSFNTLASAWKLDLFYSSLNINSIYLIQVVRIVPLKLCTVMFDSSSIIHTFEPFITHTDLSPLSSRGWTPADTLVEQRRVRLWRVDRPSVRWVCGRGHADKFRRNWQRCWYKTRWHAIDASSTSARPLIWEARGHAPETLVRLGEALAGIKHSSHFYGSAFGDQRNGEYDGERREHQRCINSTSVRFELMMWNKGNDLVCLLLAKVQANILQKGVFQIMTTYDKQQNKKR